MSQSQTAKIILLLFFLVSLTWSIFTPVFEAPDETTAYEYGRYYARTWDLPVLTKLPLPQGVHHWEPLYFILLGRIAKTQMREFYQKAVVGLAIHDYAHNLGHKVGSLGSTKFFEYMKVGLPIICSDFDLWSEIIKKYNCGICVQPNNIEQIESAIRFILEDKEKAYEMGQNGKNAILTEFNWSAQERIYLKVFSKYCF